MRIKAGLLKIIGNKKLNPVIISIIRFLIALHIPLPFRKKIHRLPLHLETPINVRIVDAVKIKIGNVGHSAIENLLYFYGINGYEPEMIPIFLALSPKLSTFIDIGASNSHYSMIVSALNTKCAVFAFEPNPACFKWAANNIRINHFDNVQLIQKAVSNYNGKAKLYKCDWNTSATIISREYQNNKEKYTEIDVVRIDDFFDYKLLKPCLVKIDVELAEADVFEGMQKFLFYNKPIIICEILWKVDIERIKKIIKKFGYYYAYHIGFNGLLKRNNNLDRSGTGSMRNFLFSRENLRDIGLADLEKK